MNFLHLTDTVGDFVNIGEDATSIVEIAEGIQKYGFIAIGFAVVVVIFLIIIGFVFIMNMKIMKDLSNRSEKSSSSNENIIDKLIDEMIKRNIATSVSVDELNKIKNSLSDELSNAVAKLEGDIDSNENKIRDAQKKLIEEYVNNNKHEADFVGKFVSDHAMFKNHSKPLIDILKCDRVGIYVFHNGNASMHGLPFYKMSCIYECTNIDQKSIRGMHHTNMPLNFYYDFVEVLYIHGEYKVENLDQVISEDYSMKEFTQYSNCKSIYIVAVKDNNGIIGGFVTVEFDEKDSFESDPERGKLVRESIDNMISAINPILISKSIYKK